MKKNVVLFLCFSHFMMGALGQKYSSQWVLGPNTSTLNFNNDTIALSAISILMNTWETNASIADTLGNLLYYTNGFYIADKNGNTLANGDTLNPSTFTSNNYLQGNPLPQAAIFLPKPDNQQYYYLIHCGPDTLNRPNTIYYSLIDKNGNGGLGIVIKKNIPILKLDENDLIRGGGITACKHANGRDYWIVVGGSNSNKFYKFLLNPDTILGPSIQYIGPVFGTEDDLAYSKFSEDGSKYVTACGVGPVLVMDFDRCSGDFSSPINIFHYAGVISNQAISGAASVEFSPSGRFLYVNNSNDLTQYDLWADTIQDSVELYVSDTSDFYGLSMLQLALNGKGYCSTWSGGLRALHVINSPDSLGIQCGFTYGGQPTLSTNSVNVPNLMNYNLGALVGSGCDTIHTGVGIANINQSNLLRVMPNPADKYLYVEMGMQGNYEFELINESGQVIDRKETRQVDNFDTERLSDGVYFLQVIDRGSLNRIATQKVIVQH